MSDGLDVIVIDDDPGICEIIAELIESFYTWGKVQWFSNPDEAIEFCLNRDIGVAIFVVDVFLGGGGTDLFNYFNAGAGYIDCAQKWNGRGPQSFRARRAGVKVRRDFQRKRKSSVEKI